jgi:hypothetical protein
MKYLKNDVLSDNVHLLDSRCLVSCGIVFSMMCSH